MDEIDFLAKAVSNSISRQIIFVDYSYTVIQSILAMAVATLKPASHEKLSYHYLYNIKHDKFHDR